VTRRPRGYRYGSWHDGPDPLAPPYDVRRALDRIGDDVLTGATPRDALRRLLRHGLDRDGQGPRGLDDMLRRLREQRKRLRESGRMDGTLEEVRRLIDTAVGQERSALFPDPSDDARFRETTLDALPSDPARAVRQLDSYDWKSPEAAQTFEQVKDLLRREVLDTQFRGMKQALENPDPEAMQRVKDMLADLNAMLAADAQSMNSEHTRQLFDEFMAAYGDMFPENPRDLEELVDSLARRAAAAERMMQSLTPQQRDELAALMAGALEDMDLASQMSQLGEALRSRRPDLDWSGRERIRGQEPLGAGDATSAVQDLADLEELEAAVGQDYPGASLEDIDEEAVRRALGRRAADDLGELRRLERELEEQGYVNRTSGRLQLTAKAIRRLGQTALRRVFADLHATARGGHDVHDAGQAGEVTGASRPWQFGDEQPLDVVRTLTNAVRAGRASIGPGSAGRGIRLRTDDFEVAETDRRTSAAVCLLVDLSYSMVLRDTWGAAKATALALHALVSGQFPQDALTVIGFSSFARTLSATELAEMDADYVQGTNLQHALILAGRFLDEHPQAEPVVLVVTDGEPTAHLLPGGQPWFAWPPEPETIELTVAEVDRMTRRGASLNVFALDDDPRLLGFMQELARRNGGRVLQPDPRRLGQYVVSDYLSRRSGGRRGRRAG
jgi:uncharacterized protein with von Willebrand factor type A (vWA) domain